MSLSLSSKCRIGALGPEGSYSEKAALLWSKGRPEATLVYFNDFEGVLEAVEAGRLEAGIVPVENSLEGAVTVVMDLLLRLDVVIVGEVNVPIRHCLVGRGEETVKVILSHPQALAQCRQYLREHYPGAEIRTTGSTSHAARLAQEFPEMAAIAGADTAENADRALAAARAVQKHLGLGGARLSIRSGYRMHVGLGGGTQLGIAAGKALCELYHQPISVREIARIIARGGTSGIGTAAFETGGFLIDGGHSYGPGKEKMSFSPSSACGGVRPASVTMRHDFPRDWKIILALPDIAAGAHGNREVDIFREYCPLPVAEVHELCYQILVRMVPSLVEENLEEFGAAVNRVQEIGFKKIEVMLQHPVVHRLMAAMREAGAACAGLSSFGPAVYAITDTQGRDVEAAAREAMREVGGEILFTRARNEGARVRTA